MVAVMTDHASPSLPMDQLRNQARKGVTPVDKVLLAPEDAAELLGIGRTKVFQLMATGELGGEPIDRCRRVTPGALIEFARTLDGGQCVERRYRKVDRFPPDGESILQGDDL